MYVDILFPLIWFSFFCYPIVTLKKLVKRVWFCPSLYDMCKHQTSVNKEREKRRWRRSLEEEEKGKGEGDKFYLYAIKKKKKKEKEKQNKTKQKKERKMKINTELVGEKVSENKSCRPSFLAFCKVYYLPHGQIFRIYSKYIVSQIKSGSTMSCFIVLFIFFMSGWLD